MNWTKLLTTLSLLLAFTSTRAQKIAMADEMRSNGKIFVVVGVIALVFLGVVGYLIHLDQRVKKLEKED